MVDYSNELRRLRQMQDDFLLRYGTSRTLSPSEKEVKDAIAIREEIGKVWERAILMYCEDSENELVEISDVLDTLAHRRNYPL